MKKGVLNQEEGINKPELVPTYPQTVSFANDLPSSASAAQSLVSQEFCEVDEIDYNRPFPWIKVIVRLLGSLNFTCDHHQRRGHKFSKRNIFKTQESQDSQSTQFNLNSNQCTVDCYLRQFKSSHCLIEAVLRMYEASNNIRIVEKYEKANEEKEIHKQNSSLSKSGTKKKNLSTKGKKDNSNSHRLNYLNSLLKKTSSDDQSIDLKKLTSTNLISERIKRDLKSTGSLSTKQVPIIPTSFTIKFRILIKYHSLFFAKES